MHIHLTARLAFGERPLSERQGSWLWDALRRFAPGALASVLMPDHLHLIAPGEDPDSERRRLARVLQGFTRAFGTRGWSSPPDPRVVPDRHHLARQVRYVALNPCRAGLVRDPLIWLWTTHRDVVGAVVDPWVRGSRLADALGERRRGFAARHHRYVSGDPSAAVDGTEFPSLGEVVAASPRAVLSAAEAACRWVDGRGPDRSREALYFGLGRRTRWTVDALRGLVPLARSTAYDRAASLGREALAAAALCLSDARLRDPRRLRPDRSPRSGPSRPSEARIPDFGPGMTVAGVPRGRS